MKFRGEGLDRDHFIAKLYLKDSFGTPRGVVASRIKSARIHGNYWQELHARARAVEGCKDVVAATDGKGWRHLHLIFDVVTPRVHELVGQMLDELAAA